MRFQIFGCRVATVLSSQVPSVMNKLHKLFEIALHTEFLLDTSLLPAYSAVVAGAYHRVQPIAALASARIRS
jgi:hypothetical protein